MAEKGHLFGTKRQWQWAVERRSGQGNQIANTVSLPFPTHITTD